MSRLLPSTRTRSVAALAAVVIALGVLAVVHDGTQTSELELDDGGVWVVNEDVAGQPVIARFNHSSRTFDAYTTPESPAFDISQAGYDLVLHQETTQGIASIDPATWQPDGSASLDKGFSAVQGADVLAITDTNTGKVWTVPADDARSFNAEAPPTMEAEPGSRTAVATDGSVIVASPDGALVRAEPGGGAWRTDEVGTTPGFAETDEVSVSAVGEVGLVLNHTEGWLAWPGHEFEIPVSEDESGTAFRLQAPGEDSGIVVVAGPSALLEIDLENEAVETITVPANGEPITPVTASGCAYAAWVATAHYVRDCADDRRDASGPVPQLRQGGDLTFRVNRNVVVLNEPATGKLWLVDANMELISDWGAIKAELQQKDEEEDKDDIERRTSERSEKNRPPNPQPDKLGVRAGTSVTLPVLANDTDPDGDVLVAELEETTTPFGALELVRDGRAVRISVDPDAAGSASFSYTAYDGREDGRADATVTLTVSPPERNAGPTLMADRTLEADLIDRGSTDFRPLPNFVDPDGDAFWISGAGNENGLSATFRADGLMRITDDGKQGPGVRSFPIRITDVGGETTEATVRVRVRGRDSLLPPVANGDFVVARPGATLSVSPLRNDLDPMGGELALLAVEAGGDVRVGNPQKDGSVELTVGAPGTHYLPYTTSNGQRSAEGLIRVDVIGETSSARPVPDDDLVVMPSSGEVVADVLVNDTDPTGGILVLQSVTAPANQVIDAEVLDHEMLRIRDNRMSPGSPVTLTYSVGNANGSATGTVTVVLDEERAAELPQTADDRAVVRAGDVVTVDVLDNDQSPSGLDLSVDPEVRLTSGGQLGRAWVADDKVRFQAGADPGAVRIRYTARDTVGGYAGGSLNLIVQAEGTNTAPEPPPATLRLLGGSAAEFLVPLDGIDPDGDSVVLLGLSKAPKHGVAMFDGGVITYEAAAQYTGVDQFEYRVEDPYGRTATGVVEVGIAAPPPVDQLPVTTLDEVFVKPGRKLSIPVTANDFDPEGGPLAVSDVVTQDPRDEVSVEPTTVDGRLQLTSPDEETVLRYTYTVTDEYDQSAVGTVFVRVSADAPLQPPVARDDVVSLSDIVGEEAVTVDVLENDEDPDGAASTLTPTLEPAVPGVTVDGEDRLVIPLRAERQVIVYTVTDPDQQDGLAVVTVPGTESLAAQRPVLRSDSDLPITVDAGGSTVIDLADHVAVRPGRTPIVRFREDLAEGAGPGIALEQQDDSRIRVTAQADYAGLTAAALSVSDGDGEDSLTSMIVFPVEVVGQVEQPDPDAEPLAPSWVTLPDIRLAPGGTWSGDMRTFVTDPDTPAEALDFRLAGSARDLSIDLDGSTLRVTADEGLRDTVTREFSVEVSDGETGWVAPPGQFIARVTEEDREPMEVARAAITVKAGETGRVDLGEYVTNPYADRGDNRIVGRPSWPAERARVSVSGLVLSITPSGNVGGRFTIQYRVADGSGDPQRDRNGVVVVEVTGLPPQPPTGVVANATASRTVEVNWTAPRDSSPPERYVVECHGSGCSAPITVNAPQTEAVFRDLENGNDYTFTVRSSNEYGQSTPSGASNVATPDIFPGQPSAPDVAFDNGKLHVTWTPPQNEGSPIQGYEVNSGTGDIVRVTGTSTILAPLDNGTPYAITVRAFNNAETGASGQPPGRSEWSPPTTETPSGNPGAPSAPQVVGDPPDPDPSATVSWSRPTSTNGADVTRYELSMNGRVVSGCALDSASATSCRVALPGRGRYSFTVRAFNRSNEHVDGWSEASPPSAEVTGANPPGAVRGLDVRPTGQDRTATVSFSPGDDGGADSVSYRYRVAGGAPTEIAPGSTQITLPGNGQDFSVSVWAVGVANGLATDGPTADDSVNPFGPCTASVTRRSENYDNVTFAWSAVPHGRPCAYSGSSGSPSSQTSATASASGEVVVGNRKSTQYDFTLTVRTVTRDRDPGVDLFRASATGRSWGQDIIDWGAGGSCAPHPVIRNCRWATLTLTDWPPNSQVECWMEGDGLPGWSRQYGVNGSGDVYIAETWGYNPSTYNPNSYDNTHCRSA